MNMVRSITSSLKFVTEEIGLNSLLNASYDSHIIILLRMVRLIAFGGSSLILVLYLKEIGLNELLIGLFLTSTFIGDLVSSFLLSIAADKIGRKKVLLLSSAIMTLTGLVFVATENFYILIATAVVGILTPSGGEVGPFRSVEQSSIASLAPGHTRSDLYAWYTFLGTFCAALGSATWGKMYDYVNGSWNYSPVESYKVTFLAYSLLSFFTLVLTLFLSEKIEWSHEVSAAPPSSGKNNGANGATTDEASNSETTQLLSERQTDEPVKKKKLGIFQELDPSVYIIVLKVSLLFALDSFASSLVSVSWQSYYIKQKFHISASYLGSVFFVTGLVSGFMSLLSTSFCKRVGPVLTMVGTHLPASILLVLVPFPNSIKLTMAILVVRASTQTMDVTPKHVFVAALVPSKLRTAVFGYVNVVKTLAQVVGPSIVGLITAYKKQWLCFILGGSLKILYDLGILLTFLTVDHDQGH